MLPGMAQSACHGCLLISLYQQLLIEASTPKAAEHLLDHPIIPDNFLTQNFITIHLNSKKRLMSPSPLLKVLRSCDDLPNFEYLDEVLKHVFENSLKFLVFSNYIYHSRSPSAGPGSFTVFGRPGLSPDAGLSPVGARSSPAGGGAGMSGSGRGGLPAAGDAGGVSGSGEAGVPDGSGGAGGAPRSRRQSFAIVVSPRGP